MIALVQNLHVRVEALHKFKIGGHVHAGRGNAVGAGINDGQVPSGDDRPENLRLGIAERFATDNDKKFAAAAQAAFDKGAGYDELQTMAKEFGYGEWRPDQLRAAIQFRQQGGQGARLAAPESGVNDPSIYDRAVQNIGESALGGYIGGAGNALTFGTIDELSGIAQGDSISDAFSGRGVNTNRMDLIKGLVADESPVANTLGNIAGGVMGTLGAGSRALGELQGEFDNTLATRVIPFLEQPQVPGRDVQAILQGLRKDASAMGGKPRADIYQDASRQAEDAVIGMVNRQSPDVMPAFNEANDIYRNSQILRDAVNKAGNAEGRFTPAQLGQVARQNAKKYGGRHGTTDVPFFELQRAGQQVLPAKLPDSGTAGRQAAGDGLTGLAKALWRNKSLPLYSDLSLDVINAGAFKRPEQAQILGDLIREYTKYGGVLGAPTAVTLAR